MELGPILRAIMRKKVGVVLLVAEIAVTMAIVLNCLNLVIDNRARMTIPSGLDEENILAVTLRSYGEAFEDDEFFDQVQQQDLALIRSQPGVIAATAIRPWPLQGGGSSTQRKVVGASNETLVRTPLYSVDEHFIDALGLELAAGRPFDESDMPVPAEDGTQPATPPPTNVIVTRALADALFPDGDALGKQITSASDEARNTIVGVVDYMHTPYDDGASGMEYRIIFFPGRPGGASGSGYLVRTEPSAFAGLFTDLESRLATVNAERIITTRSLMEIKMQGQFQNRFIVWVLTAIVTLLLSVTALGIFGMTSFAVTQRTRQIGTRRALGARKSQIVRLFLVENTVIALLGLGAGLVLAFGLNMLMVNAADNISRLSLGLVLLGMLIVWGIGALATLIPALRAARIPPVVATQSV